MWHYLLLGMPISRVNPVFYVVLRMGADRLPGFGVVGLLVLLQAHGACRDQNLEGLTSAQA